MEAELDEVSEGVKGKLLRNDQNMVRYNLFVIYESYYCQFYEAPALQDLLYGGELDEIVVMSWGNFF